MKMFKKCSGLLYFLLAIATLNSCKKDKKTSETRFDDDGWTQERAFITALDDDLGKLGTGAYKALLDTNTLGTKETYTVVFKPDFQQPIAKHYSGNDDDRPSKVQLGARDLMTKTKKEFPVNVIPDTAKIQWHNTFFCGFTTELTPYQVKSLYRDDRVDYIMKDVLYETYGAVTYMSGTHPLFVHGFKKPSSSAKKIWIIDTGGDPNSPVLNVDKTLSKTFMYNALNVDSDHGNQVAHVAGAKEYGAANCRGTAEGATVVMLKAGNGGNMNWNAVNAALEYCWAYSKRGDIVNLSFGIRVASLTESGKAAIAQMESNILDFAGWDMPVVMAAGNNNDYASLYSPCRLGMKYKDVPSTFKFIHVVANIRPTGSENEIKNGSTKFELNNDYAKPSNYGRAVRWGMMGTWLCLRTNGSAFVTSGTSFSAPAVCGILYHNVSPLAEPATTNQSLIYKKGDTYYAHLVPKVQ